MSYHKTTNDMNHQDSINSYRNYHPAPLYCYLRNATQLLQKIMVLKYNYNMLREVKEDINKSPNEDCENKNSSMK